MIVVITGSYEFEEAFNEAIRKEIKEAGVLITDRYEPTKLQANDGFLYETILANDNDWFERMINSVDYPLPTNDKVKYVGISDSLIKQRRFNTRRIL